MKLIRYEDEVGNVRTGALRSDGKAGVGMAAQLPRWLKAGDSVTIEIEKIGRMTNPVVLEA